MYPFVRDASSLNTKFELNSRESDGQKISGLSGKIPFLTAKPLGEFRKS